MKVKDWCKVLRDAATLGCHSVQFIGGEPTLHPELPSLIEFASEEGFTDVEVYTNATTLRPKLLAAFSAHKVRVAISFYSDEAAVHDAITRREGSFDRTVAVVRHMIGEGLRVRAGIVETKMNAGHGERARHLLELIGVTECAIDRQRGIGRGASDSGQMDPIAELCGACRHGTLCVTATGRAHPCVFSRFVDLGDVRDRQLPAIVAGHPISAFREALQEQMARRERPTIQCNPLTCSPPFCQP